MLSAFLDALTVTAVVIAVAEGFYGVYHKVASGKGYDQGHDHSADDEVRELHREDLDQFRKFLRNLDDACGRRNGARRRDDIGR